MIPFLWLNINRMRKSYQKTHPINHSTVNYSLYYIDLLTHLKMKSIRVQHSCTMYIINWHVTSSPVCLSNENFNEQQYSIYDSDVWEISWVKEDRSMIRQTEKILEHFTALCGESGIYTPNIIINTISNCSRPRITVAIYYNSLFRI